MLLICNFSYGWQADTVNVLTQYKAFTDDEVVADVGLHIGLRGINVTLRGKQPQCYKINISIVMLYTLVHSLV